MVTLSIGMGILMALSSGASAKEEPKKAPMMRAINNSLPSGYHQVGNTELFYNQSSNSIDFIGRYNSQYYSSTYSNGGYRVALKVNDGYATNVDCLAGSSLSGVTFLASIEQQGELAKVCYTITNTNDSTVTVSLGTHADVMIGNNDLAPISRRIDQAGNTYGLTMKDGNGTQLCVLFGSGLAGVTKVDDFWFGEYWLNREASQMVGHYSGGSNYMQENGSYDSGMGWCWKSRMVAAGSSTVFSYLIGVGEVNLEPNSTFEVTPDDPDGWNDLTRPHKLTLNGAYESPAGIDGIIEYSVEDTGQWNALTDTLASEDEFTAELIVTFNPERAIHTINFRTVDAVGNTTLLTPITYKDVAYHEISGIEAKTYSYGDSIFQSALSCDLEKDEYVVDDYSNNINVGTATFKIQGVFPKTIGSRTYSFDIVPAPLEGDITVTEPDISYTGAPLCPEWAFTSDRNDSLIENSDFTVEYSNNVLPGTGNIEVTGKGNFTGTLTSDFFIDKAQLTDTLYAFTLPARDISYDGESHPASAITAYGVGAITFTYINKEDSLASVEAPSNVGVYDVYAEFAEGTLYYGKSNEKIGSFAIYQFDNKEWMGLALLNSQLQDAGWTTSWDLAAGPVGVSKLEGLTVREGHLAGVDFSDKSLNSFPTALIAFPKLETIDLSHNNLTGNVGLLVARIPNLTGLDVSYNRFSDLYPMISPKVTDLDISHQTIDKTLDFDLANLNMEQMAAQIPTIVLYDHTNQTYSTDLNFMCTTSKAQEYDYEDEEQFAIQLRYDQGHLAMPYVSANSVYHGSSGDTLKVFAMDKDNNLNGSTFHIRLIFNQGDANFNGDVDVTDLQATILYAFNDYNRRPFNFTAADTYADDGINVQDVVCTANILISQSLQSKRGTPMKLKPADDNLIGTDKDVAYVYIEDGIIYLQSPQPVAAIDLALSERAEWNISQYGLIQSVRDRHLVGYSLSNTYIPAGTIQLGTTSEGADILKCVLSDSNANHIPVSFDKSTSGIDSPIMDNDDEYDIFDMTGRRLNSPSRGVNITVGRQGAKKVLNSNK